MLYVGVNRLRDESYGSLERRQSPQTGNTMDFKDDTHRLEAEEQLLSGHTEQRRYRENQHRLEKDYTTPSTADPRYAGVRYV